MWIAPNRRPASPGNSRFNTSPRVPGSMARLPWIASPMSAVFSPDMVEMLKHVRLNNREDISPILGERFVEVEAKMKDGSSELVRSDGPPGCFGRPKITPEKHLEKVRSCLALKLSADQIEQVIATGNRLETLTGDEIKELMGVLATK